MAAKVEATKVDLCLCTFLLHDWLTRSTGGGGGYSGGGGYGGGGGGY